MANQKVIEFIRSNGVPIIIYELSLEGCSLLFNFIVVNDIDTFITLNGIILAENFDKTVLGNMEEKVYRRICSGKIEGVKFKSKSKRVYRPYFLNAGSR